MEAAEAAACLPPTFAAEGAAPLERRNQGGIRMKAALPGALAEAGARLRGSRFVGQGLKGGGTMVSADPAARCIGQRSRKRGIFWPRLPAAGLRKRNWRKGRDLNPRMPHGINGFQDRRIKPLCHPSTGKKSQIFRQGNPRRLQRSSRAERRRLSPKGKAPSKINMADAVLT